MGLVIVHNFRAIIPNTDDSNLVSTNAWNDTHAVSGSADPINLPTILVEEPAQAATITLTTASVEVGIDTAATAVSVNLPSVTMWALANPYGLPLTIYDKTGQANTHNITPVPAGTDTFVRVVVPKVTGSFGNIKLRPNRARTAWYQY